MCTSGLRRRPERLLLIQRLLLSLLRSTGNTFSVYAGVNGSDRGSQPLARCVPSTLKGYSEFSNYLSSTLLKGNTFIEYNHSITSNR